MGLRQNLRSLFSCFAKRSGSMASSPKEEPPSKKEPPSKEEPPSNENLPPKEESPSVQETVRSPEDAFTIEVDAVETKAATYSDVQPAEDQGTFSDQRRGRAIIQGQFHRIEHGRFKGEPAVLLKMELTFRSAGKDQIVEGGAEFAFNRGTAPGKDDAASGAAPALRAVAPFTRRALHAHAKHVSKGTKFDPSVDVGGFGGGTGEPPQPPDPVRAGRAAGRSRAAASTRATARATPPPRSPSTPTACSRTASRPTCPWP